MSTTPRDSARPDDVRRGAVHDQNGDRNGEDGVASVSARTLADIARSVEGLGRGVASAPVNLDETFPGLGDVPAAG